MKTTQAVGREWLPRDLMRGLKRIAGLPQVELLGEVTAVAGLTLLAAGLRLYRLGAWSFWGDEVITVGRARDFLSLAPHHWSVTRLLTYFSFGIFGVSEWSARLAPAVMGAITVPVAYMLVRKVWGRGTALLAASLLGISTWHLYWSQNARFYSALLLFYTVGMVLVYRGLEEDRPGLLIGSLLMFGFAVQERLVALLFVPVIGSYLMALKFFGFQSPKGLRWKNLLIFIVPGALMAAVLALAYPVVRQPAQWLSIFGSINTNPFWILSGVVYYVGIPVIAMATVAAAHRLIGKTRSVLFLALGAVVPVVGIMLVSTVHYAANRYVFVTLPFWIILASIATIQLLREAEGHMRILAGGIVLILAASSLSEDFLYYRYQNGNRDDWRSAFSFVETQMLPEDVIVSANSKMAEYYLDGNIISMAAMDPAGLEQLEQRTWFVEDMTAGERFPEVLSWIDANAQVTAIFDVHVRARNFKMRVYLWDPSDG